MSTGNKLQIHRLEAPRKQRTMLFKLLAFGFLAAVLSLASFSLTFRWQSPRSSKLPIHASETLHKCRQLSMKPGPPQDFYSRTQSDRFVVGTPPTLLRNASIWTGRVSGHEVVLGDVLLDNGLIKSVGTVDQRTLDAYNDLVVIDVAGAWITPGIVDLHSHLGVFNSPVLNGARDTNSFKGLIQPWLRSLDGLNTHDEAYRLSAAGGVTTSVVLPGSANAIGGQAFVIKLRPTSERSPSSMLLEPPYSLNRSHADPSSLLRWRQMKHACGENPSRVYSGSRMDTIWAFRQGYDTARKIKQKQDEYCAKALSGEWDGLDAFPEDLQWEALVDVLRGRVKVHTHCYEATDLDGLVRLSNEFKFPIAAFHHGHETYLVPELIKKTYGKTPAVALFATNARYKREAYRGSEFAPRILAGNGFKVVMKSDHPVLNSRYLLYEAQQAHYYGLADNLALASVTSTPATVMGQDHRIGFITPGYDADVVVWDSHPLSLGAAPKQVFIDGIAQIEQPYSVDKEESFQHVPNTPNFDKEAADAVKYDGLPPLEAEVAKSDVIIFTNLLSIHLRDGHTVRQVFSAAEGGKAGIVIVHNGSVICTGMCSVASFSGAQIIDLEGGAISPGLVSFGSSLGLNHIRGEPSTNDGDVFDPLTTEVPDIVGGDGSVIHAVDGLQYATRDALLAYRNGVTTGVVAPISQGFLSGLSTAFSTGATHRLQKGAVIQNTAALHVAITSSTSSISTQITALRRLLFGDGRGDLASHFQHVVQGKVPLVVEVHSADIMASLIELKRQVEDRNRRTIQLTFSGASEAHLLAKEIAQAGVGVILTQPRPFPGTWESRRILPGPPLTKSIALVRLLAHNVTVGLGVEEQWNARNLRFDTAWAALEANGKVSSAEAIALASVKLEMLLGINTTKSDLVAIKGGTLLGIQGKVVSIISPHRGVHLF